MIKQVCDERGSVAAIEWRLIWIYWHCSRSTSHIVSGVYSIRKLHDWFQKTDNFESVSFVLSHFFHSCWYVCLFLCFYSGYDKYARIHTASKKKPAQKRQSECIVRKWKLVTQKQEQAKKLLQLHVYLYTWTQCVYTSIELHIANLQLNRWSTSDSLYSPSIAFVCIVKNHLSGRFIHLYCIFALLCFVYFSTWFSIVFASMNWSKTNGEQEKSAHTRMWNRNGNENEWWLYSQRSKFQLNPE